MAVIYHAISIHLAIDHPVFHNVDQIQHLMPTEQFVC